MRVRRNSLRFLLLLGVSVVLLWLLYRSLTVFDMDCAHYEAVTFVPDGDFGSIMCQYAHLKHLQITYAVKVGLLVITEDILSVFPHLTLQSLSGGCLAKADMQGVELDFLFTELSEAGELRRSAVITGRPCELSILWPHTELWRREFAWSAEINLELEGRRTRLQSSSAEHSRAAFQDRAEVVGVYVAHAEREEENYGAQYLLPRQYYLNAFAYLRAKYPVVQFILVTDDPDWCAQQLVEGATDVILADYAQPFEDLALLASLSHLVLSHGTLGVWASMLANPRTLLYPAMRGQGEQRYSQHAFFDRVALSSAVAIDF